MRENHPIDNEAWRGRVVRLLADVDAIPGIVAELRNEQYTLRDHARIVSRTVIRLALSYLDFQASASRCQPSQRSCGCGGAAAPGHSLAWWRLFCA